MVNPQAMKIGTGLRRAQLCHTFAFIVFLIFVALSPAFHVTVNHGQSFRILASQGPTGQFLFWSGVVVIVAQIAGYKRFSVLSLIAYSWVGASFVFVGIAVPAGESLLNSQIAGASSVLEWIAVKMNTDFEKAKIEIYIGSAWILLALAGASLILLSSALLAHSYRNRKSIC